MNNGKTFHREIYTSFFWACPLGLQIALIKVPVNKQDIDLQLICNQIMFIPILVINKAGELGWPSFFSMSICFGWEIRKFSFDYLLFTKILCICSNYCRKTYLPWDVHSKDGTISLLECHCSVLQYIRSARTWFVNGKCWWCVWTRSLSKTIPSSSNSERKASILIWKLSCDMWFPTMWHFDECWLRRACAASF